MKTSKFTEEQIAFALKQAEWEPKVEEIRRNRLCKRSLSNQPDEGLRVVRHVAFAVSIPIGCT
jgi:hypothetical protein